MRNVKMWRQGSFSGGINTASPPTQLEEDELVDILNMFPNDKGSELMLRSAFLENGETESGLPYDHLIGSRIITVSGAVVDGLLGALLESGIVEVHALLPSPYELDTNESGTGEWIPPIVTRQPVPANMVTWDEISTETLTPAYATDIEWNGAYDFWLDDLPTPKMEPTGLDTGRNESLWLPDAGTYSQETNGITFFDEWHLAGDKNQKIACDTWWDAESDIMLWSLFDSTPPEKFLVCTCPWWRVDEQISGISGKTSPKMMPPTVEFTATIPTNSVLSFCFDYDTNMKGISARVFVKNNKNPNASWSPVHLRNGIEVPLILDDQTLLNANERYLGTGDLAEYIVCSKVIPYPDVAVKIEFIPSRIDADNVEVGGIFVGYHTAEQ